MISLSAPMCVPSNTVPSSKIKNAFILSSHSAAFRDVCVSLSILRYLRIAPLLRSSRNSENIRNPRICFANRCFLMFWRFKSALASPCKHGRLLPFKSGICIIGLLYHKRKMVAIDPSGIKTHKKPFRNVDTPWRICQSCEKSYNFHCFFPGI